MTLAFVSVTLPDWFPLQIAILASDQILGAVSNTYRGKIPPVYFLVEAWANTVHYFAETMRMQKRSAADIIGSLNQWEHWWKYTPSSSDSSGSAAPRSEPDNRELRNQLEATSSIGEQRLQSFAMKLSSCAMAVIATKTTNNPAGSREADSTSSKDHPGRCRRVAAKVARWATSARSAVDDAD